MRLKDRARMGIRVAFSGGVGEAFDQAEVRARKGPPTRVGMRRGLGRNASAC